MRCCAAAICVRRRWKGRASFSRRGGILDFFSPAYPQPVRVEFWGDDVDSMGFFDPESQRRTQPLDSCRILPAAETLPPLYPGGSAALSICTSVVTVQGVVSSARRGGT